MAAMGDVPAHDVLLVVQCNAVGVWGMVRTRALDPANKRGMPSPAAGPPLIPRHRGCIKCGLVQPDTGRTLPYHRGVVRLRPNLSIDQDPAQEFVWMCQPCWGWARETSQVQRLDNGSHLGYRLLRQLKQARGSCARCGVSTQQQPTCCFAFHHRDPRTKLGAIAALTHDAVVHASVLPRELLDAEVAKCDLLCRGCRAHARYQERTTAELSLAIQLRTATHARWLATYPVQANVKTAITNALGRDQLGLVPVWTD